MKNVLILLLAGALLPGWADTTVSDVIVNQRWPWSEKVDVDFTLTGDAADVDVTATWDGQSAPVLLGTIFAAMPGSNRVTWDPAATSLAGKTLTGFSVTVAPASADAHRYLVIDLQNGGVSYRAEPDGTDGKWSDDYKTTKMAFRRIPAGTYQLGMESNQIAKVAGGSIDAETATAWKRHDITFSSDFYVGVFKMTGAQCNLLKGNSAGTDLTPKSVSYDGIRGSVDEGVNWRQVKRVTQVDFDDNLIRPMDRALAAAGIETDHVLVRSRPELGRFAGIEAAAFEKFRDYPRKKYPDVFFIWDTFVARGFFMALQNLGVRIPEDVFVVAQANRGLGLSSPCTVTRFEADGVADGKTVAEFALASLQKGRIPNVPSVGREYVIGGTFPC